MVKHMPPILCTTAIIMLSQCYKHPRIRTTGDHYIVPFSTFRVDVQEKDKSKNVHTWNIAHITLTDIVLYYKCLPRYVSVESQSIGIISSLGHEWRFTHTCLTEDEKRHISTWSTYIVIDLKTVISVYWDLNKKNFFLYILHTNIFSIFHKKYSIPNIITDSNKSAFERHRCFS